METRRNDHILLKWLLTTVAVLITGMILSRGIHVEGFFAALLVALGLGLVNTFLRPLILLLTLPLNILTLGLLTLAINALLVLLVDWAVAGFSVENFWWALLFSLVQAVVVGLLSWITPR